MSEAVSTRDPVCGMTGVFERHGHWFCSEHCAQEYARRAAAPEGAPTCHRPVRARWRDPWVWVPVTGLLVVTAGGWWDAAAAVSASYRGYLAKVGVPFVLGLIIGGIVDHFVPKAYIVTYLSGAKKRVIARATLLGFLASSCSHGCLALSIELYRKGASIPAVVSFLLASPWASMSLTLILLGLFGIRALLLIAGALLIALCTGLIFQRLASAQWIERNPNTIAVSEDFSVWSDLRARAATYPWTVRQLLQDARGVVRGMVPLGRMVLGWVQLGLLLSVVLGTTIPHAVFERHFGPSVAGLLLTLALAAVVEVCSEGTAPLAYELYRHTGAFGNSFVFLMGGVVTDYTELGALWAAIGRRTVLWLVAVTLPMVVALGLIWNLVA